MFSFRFSLFHRRKRPVSAEPPDPSVPVSDHDLDYKLQFMEQVVRCAMENGCESSPLKKYNQLPSEQKVEFLKGVNREDLEEILSLHRKNFSFRK